MLKFPGKVRNKHKKWKEVKFLLSTVNIYIENLQVLTDKNYQSDVKGGSQCGNKYN